MNNTLITLEAKTTLLQLLNCINVLTYDEYTEKFEILNGSSIGEHTRHIIELFQQLVKEYESGFLDYDSRKRDVQIQGNIDFALDYIANIIQGIKNVLNYKLYQSTNKCRI